MSKPLRVAIGQTVSRLEDTAGNMAQACLLASDAAAQGARLLLLPEGCLTGNALTGPDKQASLPADAAPFAPLQTVADDHDITICAGFATPVDGKFNMVHAIVRPGQEMLFQHKAFRADGEPSFLVAWPDPGRADFEVDGVSCVIQICSESGGKEIKEAIARIGPQLLLHPSAGKMKTEQVLRGGDFREDGFEDECRANLEKAMKRIRDERRSVLAANPIGFDGETWWPGNSYAIDTAGDVVLWLKGENRPDHMKPSVAVGDLSVCP